jgi:predicted TIM-barrel enzyme
MSEWIVEVETAGGIATGASDLERFARALDAHDLTARAAASVNSVRGVVSAAFTVEAADAVRAAELCVNAFRAALSESGLTEGEAARVVVERAPLGEAIAV